MPVRPATRLRRWLGANVRLARERRGWTQEKAAEAIGISVQQLRRIERAATNSSLDLLARIAEVHKIDVRDLLAPRTWRARGPGRPTPAKQ